MIEMTPSERQFVASTYRLTFIFVHESEPLITDVIDSIEYKVGRLIDIAGIDLNTMVLDAHDAVITYEDGIRDLSVNTLGDWDNYSLGAVQSPKFDSQARKKIDEKYPNGFNAFLATVLVDLVVPVRALGDRSDVEDDSTIRNDICRSMMQSTYFEFRQLDVIYSYAAMLSCG